ncbi:hypothetical protein XA68_12143 [Ophiocordyceps unilateralis]|uniref:Uncharacterized protein n=1 Tax=Ophiocordyceps unilateralis TaxID=268505 RepID=A0A2A9PDJ1_OPHUN|nr:hypothetical protein XA68_12143 [Ophiocordyceps unilateralis]
MGDSRDRLNWASLTSSLELPRVPVSASNPPLRNSSTSLLELPKPKTRRQAALWILPFEQHIAWQSTGLGLDATTSLSTRTSTDADVAASSQAVHPRIPRGMDPARVSSAHHGLGRNMASHESPEQLLDVFKAAALSVTKLYKTSALAESRARTEGYQECLQDLLMLLDRENLGLRDGEGWTVRAWATERLDGRDPTLQATESEDEVERSDRTTSPELARTSTEPQQPAQRAAEPSAASVVAVPEEPARIVVPTQDSFTFQSTHPYPNIATLDLSDSRHDVPSLQTSRSSKARIGGSKSGSRTSGHLGRGAGTKRRWDLNDFFAKSARVTRLPGTKRVAPERGIGWRSGGK